MSEIIPYAGHPGLHEIPDKFTSRTNVIDILDIEYFTVSLNLWPRFGFRHSEVQTQQLLTDWI